MSRCGDCPISIRSKCEEDLVDSECIDKLQDKIYDLEYELKTYKMKPRMTGTEAVRNMINGYMGGR